MAHAWNDLESHQAAATVSAGVIRANVYTILRERPEGLTCSELVDIYQSTIQRPATEQGIRSRLPELARQGLARKTEERRPNSRGRMERVWKADA